MNAAMVGIAKERELWLARCILPHEPALRAWLRHRPVTGLNVDDIVQDTYARLVSLASVEEIRDPKNYLFQTAYSVIATYRRRLRVVSIQTVSDVNMLNVAIDEFTPERLLEARNELQGIAEAIRTLPPDTQEVFVLRRVYGYSQREVAEQLRVTESVVEHQMARGIRLLMDVFGRGGNSERRSSSVIRDAPCNRNDQPQEKPGD